jgi:GT2 family glycosyltransferase
VSDRLLLSVVVSASDSGATLRPVLEAIRASSLQTDSYELIVVDDVSRDDTVSLSARYADTVVRLTGSRRGRSYAKNRGAELAGGEFVAFIDGDVIVRPDTLERMLHLLLQRDLTAVSASHDEMSGPRNFVSEYWNLLVRFGEEQHAGRCAQFAPGCGMVRRDAFLAAGMYDEWRFATECLEAAELGQRLRGAGYDVLLSPELKVSHLKTWTLESVATEVWRRGRLLARTLGYARMRTAVPSEVVFTLTRSLIPVAGLLGSLSLASAFVPRPSLVARGGIVLGVFLVSNLSIHRFYARTRGVAFAIAAAPLHIFSQGVVAAALCIGWLMREVFGDPSPDATTQAYSEVGVETWPPVRRRL